MDNEKILQKCLKVIDSMERGDKFEVKKLFKGCEWEKFSKGECSTFGRYFASIVKEGKYQI